MNLMIEICNKCPNGKAEIILRENGEICPGDTAPALAVDRQKVTAMVMRWGFHTQMSGRLIINARSESVGERKMFSQLVSRQRCALPIAGYFEWRDEDNLKYRIVRKDRRIFYLAGLYRHDEADVPHFVVLTRSAYGEHAEIHNRMPCLLHSKEEARRWISGDMPLDELCVRTDDDLLAEAQGHEQLKMDFDD